VAGAGSAAAGEKPETTHISVLDREGNAVSLTYTVNGLFGAGVMAPGTGFLLNDEMDDFTTKPGVPNLLGLVRRVAHAGDAGGGGVWGERRSAAGGGGGGGSRRG
jgi:gamma-glutamyltranspeptidase/glutathione hydrolase